MDFENMSPPPPPRGEWLNKMIEWKKAHPPIVTRLFTEVFVDRDGERYELPPRRVKMRADLPTTSVVQLDWRSPSAPREGTSRYLWLKFLIAKRRSERRIERGEARPWDYWPDSPPPNLPIWVDEDLREPTRRVQVKVEPDTAPPPEVTTVDPGPPLTKEEQRELRRKVFLEMEGIKEEERPAKAWAALQERKRERREELRQARKVEAQLFDLRPEVVPDEDESDFESDEAPGPRS
jgi:hypothetical protein